jgi:hypothetical protein
MASVSYGLNKGLSSFNDPQAITKGTVAASGNDIVLSMDLTKSLTTEDVILALEAFKNRLATGAIGNADLTSI